MGGDPYDGWFVRCDNGFVLFGGSPWAATPTMIGLCGAMAVWKKGPVGAGGRPHGVACGYSLWAASGMRTVTLTTVGLVVALPLAGLGIATGILLPLLSLAKPSAW